MNRYKITYNGRIYLKLGANASEAIDLFCRRKVRGRPVLSCGYRITAVSEETCAVDWAEAWTCPEAAGEKPRRVYAERIPTGAERWRMSRK